MPFPRYDLALCLPLLSESRSSRTRRQRRDGLRGSQTIIRARRRRGRGNMGGNDHVRTRRPMDVSHTSGQSEPSLEPAVTLSFFYVLLDRPPVYVVSSGSTLQSGVALALRHANGRSCHILARPSWHLPDLAPQILRVDRWLRRECPTARLVSM